MFSLYGWCLPWVTMEARELVQDVHLQRCDLTKSIGSINKFLWRKSTESHVNDNTTIASTASTNNTNTNNKVDIIIINKQKDLGT